MSIFNVIYDLSGMNQEQMAPTVVTYGTAAKLRKNTCRREGYVFLGWKAYRLSDGKTCYCGPAKKRRYFEEGKQPEGWKLHIYKDACNVSRLSRIDNDVIIMQPQWQEEKAELVCRHTNKAEENKELLRQRLLSRPVVLLGGLKECKVFYGKYAEKIKIRLILLDDEEGEKAADGIEVKKYSAKELQKEDYVILCRPVKIRLDSLYRNAKRKLMKSGRKDMVDFMRADIAGMLLDKKKLWLWFGYCQIGTLCNDVFLKLKSIREQWVLTAFRYGLDTLESSYKFEECRQLLMICDCLTYLPVVFAEGKVDFQFQDYLAADAKQVALPRTPFRGYYPWRESNMETFFHYSIDGKLHWPFGYQESIIDHLILEGKADEEIYQELMREDLIPEKEILKNLKLTYKFIEISEKQGDIKILDFLKENLTKRLLYRDGMHYQNFLYFELARRISAYLGFSCGKEIDELEAATEQAGIQFIDYTEIPILPCVAKALGMDFITEDTLYRIRFTEKGAWRGTNAVIRKMNRKDWIYTYIRYTRACMTLTELWCLEV